MADDKLPPKTADAPEDHIEDDVWGAEDAEKASGGIKANLASGIPPAYRRNMVVVSLVLVAFSVVFIVLPLLRGDSKPSVDTTVQAGGTSSKQIPDTTPGAAPLYGINTAETQARKKAEDEQLDEAVNTGSSGIAAIPMFDEETVIERTAGADLSPPPKPDPIVVGVQDSMRRTGRLKEINPANDQSQASLFVQMRERNKIDTQSWDQNVDRMIRESNSFAYGGDDAAPIQESEFDAPGNAPRDALDVSVSGATRAPDERTSGAGDDNFIKQGLYYTAEPTEVHWVELVGELNTDEPGVIARIITGPLKGARLQGVSQVLESKRLGIVFNRLIFRDQVAPVKLVVMDPESLRHSVEGQIDNHYFSRFAPFVLAKFAGAYAETLLRSTSVINTDGSTTTQSNPIPDSKDQIRFAAGSTLEELLPVWEGALTRKPTGTIEKGAVLMAMFVEPAAID